MSNEEQSQPLLESKNAKNMNPKSSYLLFFLHLVTQTPRWLQGLSQGVWGEDLVAGQLADAARAVLDGLGVHIRQAAAVAADGAGVAAGVVVVDELAGGRKVETGKGAGFAEGVTG